MTNTKSKCAALLEEAGLGDKVVTKGQTLWSNRIDSYWSVSAALEPDCMVLPTTAEDVSKIMKVITKNQCKFGIRGGGHGNFALSNSVDEGITVDFGKTRPTSLRLWHILIEPRLHQWYDV
jgi:FAD/FMN-containing dehydrogenase